MRNIEHFFSKTFLKAYLEIISVFTGVFFFIFMFVTIPEKYQLFVFGISVISLPIGYVVFWVWANKLHKTTLKINNTTVIVKVGNIFGKEEGLKVIPFNEYFDTVVNETIISASSLNGVFIKEHIKNVDDLDKEILANVALKPYDSCVRPFGGKPQKYKLGSIHVHNDDYLLMSFSRFDESNHAFLTVPDYIECLLNFWKAVEGVANQRPVIVPLLGSKMTKIGDNGNDNGLEKQENLELLIWSFKVSQIKRVSKLTIMIHESVKDDINFYKLKESTICLRK